MQKFLKKYNSALFWYFIFLVLLIPLYPKFPLIGVSGSFVAIRLEDLLIAVFVAFWGLYIIASGEFRKLFKNTLFLALVAFFFVSFVSVFSASFLTKTAAPLVSALHFVRRIELMIFLPVAFTLIDSRLRFKKFLFTAGIVVLVSNIYALGQKYLSFPAVSTTTSELSRGFVYFLQEGERVNSTFAGHYDFGIFLMISIVFLVSIALYTSDKVLKKSKKGMEYFKYTLFIGMLTLFSFYNLVETAARLSFAAVFFGLFLLLVLVRKYKYIALIFIVVVAVSLYPSNLRNRFISTFEILTAQNTNTYQGTEDQLDRGRLNIPTLPILTREVRDNSTGIPDIAPGEPTDSTDLGVYRSFSIRFNMEWPRAIRAFYKNPLLGTGYSSIGLATDNDYLRMLGEVGILGTIAFFLIIIEVVKRGIRKFKDAKGFYRYYYGGFLAMVTAVLANALFIDVFEASKVATLFWMSVGASLAEYE